VIPGAANYARLALLVIVCVILQVSGFARLAPLEGSGDLVPLLVGAVAFLCGSVPGAVTGFAAGLLLDLLIGPQLGASSLVLVGVGYGTGRFRELRDPGHGLMPVAIGVAATAGYLLGTAVVSLMLAVEAPISALVLRDAIVTVALNGLLALPLFALVRRVLRPAIAADPFARRRRSAEPLPTGPIGLRGLDV
jgi:rod shape-determining protein MreD